MITIKQIEMIDADLEKLMSREHEKYDIKNDVDYNYTPFNFAAYENNEIAGVLKGYTCFSEVNIGNLIVLEKHRGKGVGIQLIKQVKNHFKNKGFNNINLSTYEFQAPEFYKKCDFELEFIRENKDNPKLTKYFFVKYFDKGAVHHNLKMISNEKLPFLQFIENGKKKAEGRIATDFIKSFKIGELLKLESPTEHVICEITYLNFYKSFEKMLTTEGLKNMLPFVNTLEEGIKVYQSFPGADRVEKLGCCAIGVKHISSELDFLKF